MFEGECLMGRFALVHFEWPVGKRFFHGVQMSLELLRRYKWVIVNEVVGCGRMRIKIVRNRRRNGPSGNTSVYSRYVRSSRTNLKMTDRLDRIRRVLP